MSESLNAIEEARRLGATIKGGIAWTWAVGFKNHATATEFTQWLNSNGWEHRGIYISPGHTTCDVRFRKDY